jgi:hypothetical protein
MGEAIRCEYCDRPIKGEPENKVLRGKKHTFCTEFCFRLYFYNVPKISYEDLMKMYELRYVTVNAPDLHELAGE